MNNQPKISIVEAVYLIMGVGLLEIIPALLVLVGLTDFGLTGILGATTQFYFRFKKVNGAGYDLIATIGELAPYVNVLPLKTIGVVAVIWIDHHPSGRIAKTAERVAIVKKTTTAAPGKAALGGIKKAA